VTQPATQDLTLHVALFSFQCKLMLLCYPINRFANPVFAPDNTRCEQSGGVNDTVFAVYTVKYNISHKTKENNQRPQLSKLLASLTSTLRAPEVFPLSLSDKGLRGTSSSLSKASTVMRQEPKRNIYLYECKTFTAQD